MRVVTVGLTAVAAVTVALPLLPAFTPRAALACVVGTGSGTCTESTLNTCLPGGGSFDGTVTFNCGGAATIIVTGTKTVSADTSIDGGGLITISGGNSVGVFSVNTGVNFTVQNLSVTNGYSARGGGIANGGITGAGRVIVGGTLTVTNSTFSNNSANRGGSTYNGGGAIENIGTLTVTNSTFSGNSANHGASPYNGGGAIENLGTLTVTNSTFSGNNSTADGGAIVNETGAIENGGVLTVTNSTFSGNNSAEDGGGIASGDGTTLTVTNSTFSGNSADSGGAINSSGTLTVTNTIVANSLSGGNCQSDGVTTDGGHNIDDDGSCGFSTGTTHPQLDPAGLKSNGGPTQTIALQMGSPAIDAGDETVCSMPPVNNLDQRGYVRPGNGATSCSIGAYEYNAVPASPSLTSAITATDTCIPVSDTSIFSPTGGFALIGTELISYTGLGTSCSGASAARASAGTAATAGVLTGVTRNLNGQGGAHATGTTVTPTAAPCVGDCNGDGSVTVDEIITMVNIALGNAPVTACEAGDANHDGQITVDEILAAVNNALNGCSVP